VPTQVNGKTFVLYFSARRAKAELTISGPSKWEKPLVTDDQGRITLRTPWAGRYVLEINLFRRKAGGSGEKSLTATRHISVRCRSCSNGIRWSEKR